MFKRSLSFILSLLIVLSIFTVIPATAVHAAAAGTGYYKVQTSGDSLTIRKSPTTDSSRLGYIPNGVAVKVTELSGNWGKTAYNGISGWISLDYAVKVDESSVPTYSTASRAILDRLDELKVKFPDGKYWNHYGSPTKNPDGWTNTPCPSGHYLNGVQQCNGQCDGFAKKLGVDLFGQPISAWETTGYSIDTVCVGDLIRYNGKHTIMVIGFTENRNELIIADCNWDYHCVIRWDASFSTSRYFRTVNWVLHFPGNNFTRDVYLNKNLESLTLSKTSLSLKIGESSALSAALQPDVPVTVKWSSSNPSVAKVDQNGKVTAVAPGSADITASAEGKTAKCTVTVTTEVSVRRIYGTSRIGTSVAIAKEAWGKGTDNVILTNGYSFADALAGVPLSRPLNAPILLTANSDKGLESEIMAQITAVGAKNVYILGGELAVSAAIEKQLQNAGLRTERLAGTSRFDTAVAIAKKLESITGPADEIFFTNAYSFADALSVGPAAAIGCDPILYVPSTGEISGSTKEFVAGSSCSSAVVIGGPLSIAEAVSANLTNCGVPSFKRIYGTSRFDTCLAIIKEYSRRFDISSITLATGYSFPDALAGGAYAAKQAFPLVLAGNSISPEMRAWLDSAQITRVRAFGGPLAIDDATLYQYAA